MFGGTIMPRFLGIDFGAKHIGVAVGDTYTGLAVLAGTIRLQGGEADGVRGRREAQGVQIGGVRSLPSDRRWIGAAGCG